MEKKNKTKEEEIHKCKFCGDVFNYSFESDLEGTRPRYLMFVSHKVNKLFKKKKENTFSYICLECALDVNESLMRCLRNAKYQKMKFEKELVIK